MRTVRPGMLAVILTTALAFSLTARAAESSETEKREEHRQKVTQLLSKIRGARDDDEDAMAAVKELGIIGTPHDLHYIGEIVSHAAHHVSYNSDDRGKIISALEKVQDEIVEKHWDEINRQPKLYDPIPGWTGLYVMGTGFDGLYRLNSLRLNDAEKQLIVGGRKSLPEMWKRLEQFSFDKHIGEYEEVPEEIRDERKFELVGLFVNFWLRYLLNEDEIQRFLATQVESKVITRPIYCKTDPVYLGAEVSLGCFGGYASGDCLIVPKITPILDGRRLRSTYAEKSESKTGMLFLVQLGSNDLTLGEHTIKFELDSYLVFQGKRHHMVLETDEKDFGLTEEWPAGSFGPVSNPELDRRMRGIIKAGRGPDLRNGTLMEYMPQIHSDEPLPVTLISTIEVEVQGQKSSRCGILEVLKGEKVKWSRSHTLPQDPNTYRTKPGTYQVRVILRPYPEAAIKDPCIGQFWGGEYISEYFTLEAKDLTKDMWWGPDQAAGEPDTPGAGDYSTAWCSETPDGKDEWLLLDYDEAVRPTAVKVYETYNPGALSKVCVFGPDNKEVEVWSGKDPTPVGSGKGVSEIKFSTEFEIRRVKIYLNSKEVKGWNSVDAVGLVDSEGKTHWALSAQASSIFIE